MSIHYTDELHSGGQIWPSESRTSAAPDAEIVLNNHCAVIFEVDVTDSSATPTLLVGVQIFGPASQTWKSWLTLGTFTGIDRATVMIGTRITDTLTKEGARMTIGGGFPITHCWDYPLPHRIRMNAFHADSDPITYSLGISIIKAGSI